MNACNVRVSTPRPARAYQRHLAAALADPKVYDWLSSTGQQPVGNTPEEFAEQFRADVARFAKVIEQAHIPKLD
jgi:tripartite-type tricarboxylate transporter receptor subunit TctC